MSKYQKTFEELVRSPNSTDVVVNLRAIALAIWYEEFVPYIVHFSGKEASQAGYIVDKLTRYRCINRAHKTLLRNTLLPELKQQKLSFNRQNKDKLASYWGAEYEMKAAFKAILPYQRRSFQRKYSELKGDKNVKL